MGRARKLRLFEALVKTGLKEIEVGFPAASQTDFNFVRTLIEEGRIPADVTIQVLTQAREDQILRTVDSLRGARRAIVHLYNSTSTLQRRVVFGQERDAIRDLAIQGTRWIQAAVATLTGTETVFEYSPESFTGTELDFAAEVCDAVVATWDPAPGTKVIINLPATVEMASPNHYADRVDAPAPGPARAHGAERAPAQRPGLRRGRGGAGAAGRRRPGGGHPVRQR
jgi:2-isopropylmalate synthase